MTKICPLCGAENPDNAKFCHKCGTPLTEGTVVCKVCGAKNPDSAEFCKVCGSPLKPITRLIKGRYRLIRMIGQGGFGSTYLATDELLFGRKVVLKEFLERKKGPSIITKEGMILARLNHPLIPKIHGFFEDRGKVYLAQDFIDGKNLRVIIETKGKLPEDEVVKILKDILDTLHYLQTQDPPLVHRDIKPENIILSGGRAYLVDFGAVKELSPEALKHKTIIYTKGYVSPEQRRGEPSLSSDLFSLGIVTIEMLTALSPSRFVDKATKKINYSILSAFRQEFIEFVIKMTSVDTTKRFGNAGEALEDLEVVEKMATLRKFTLPLTQSGNINEEQYNSILKTAEKLGIPREKAKLVVEEIKKTTSTGKSSKLSVAGGKSKTHSKTFRKKLVSVLDKVKAEPVEMIGKIKAHQAKISSLSFSNDGSLLVSGGWEGVVKVFNTKTWQKVISLKASRQLSGHVYEVKVSQKGRRIAACNSDGEVRVWEIGTWLLAKALKAHEEEVNSLEFVQNEEFIFSGSSDGLVRGWDSVYFHKAYEFDGADGWVLKLKNISKYVFAGTNTGEIYIWDIITGKQKKKLKEHNGWINFLDINIRKGLIYSTTEDGEIVLWKISNLKPEWKGNIAEEPVESITSTPDNSLMIFSTGDTVHLFDTEKKQKLTSFNARSRITSIAYAPHSMYFATGDEAGDIKLWRFKEK